MLEPIILSFKVATISMIITLLIALMLAYIMTYKGFKGKELLESIITLPLVLPPSIVGYILLIALGKNSLLGSFLYELFGVRIIFTWIAAVMASVVVTLPLMYQSIKASFNNIDPVFRNAAETLGAGKIRVFFTILMPLSSTGILSGLILSFCRALGEFGATLFVAGNIPGKTQTIPLAIYFAVESGDTATANKLVLIMVVFSFIVMWALNYLLKKKHYIELIRREKC
ncbi:molybdate ABC transporter permease subunit [Wukongibacter sp. M2B1]|uniref:molybdate ABC transporter permease subunit n=1 Tax=Wukongibacter sp. M2B1 TaxID=3088895 RepID=UPI003D78F6F6